MPGFAVTTDIIVGFPGETEEDFQQTRGLMDEIGFDNAFIFKYSPRPGTIAAALKDDVPMSEKMRRNKQLLKDQDVRGERINKSLVGGKQEVIVEGPSLRNAAKWSGRSRTNKIVIFDPVKGVLPGDIVQIKVNRAAAQTLYGEVADECAGEPCGGKRGFK